MNKYSYYILIFFIFPIQLFAQSNYYIIDSSSSVGINLIDGGDLLNSSLCQVKTKNEVLKFSPYEVSEYGFKDGRIYYSKEIQLPDSTQRVFLECIVKGKTNLYYYKGIDIRTFFLEKDSTLFVEVPKYENVREIDFNEKLQELTSDCLNFSDATKLVNYNKKSLERLIERYNKCSTKPFPFFKYGLTIGYGGTKLIASPSFGNDLANQISFKYEKGFDIGLFIEKPIYVSDFSFHTELSFARYGFSYTQRINDKDIDFVANTSALYLPLLIRYSVPTNTIRPFLNAGACLSYNIENKNSMYAATINQNEIEILGEINSTLITEEHIGYALGGGIEYKINYKRSLFFEIRYNRLYGFSGSESLGNSEIQFFTGINF